MHGGGGAGRSTRAVMRVRAYLEIRGVSRQRVTTKRTRCINGCCCCFTALPPHTQQVCVYPRLVARLACFFCSPSLPAHPTFSIFLRRMADNKQADPLPCQCRAASGRDRASGTYDTGNSDVLLLVSGLSSWMFLRRSNLRQ